MFVMSHLQMMRLIKVLIIVKHKDTKGAWKLSLFNECVNHHNGDFRFCGSII